MSDWHWGVDSITLVLGFTADPGDIAVILGHTVIVLRILCAVSAYNRNPLVIGNDIPCNSLINKWTFS